MNRNTMIGTGVAAGAIGLALVGGTLLRSRESETRTGAEPPRASTTTPGAAEQQPPAPTAQAVDAAAKVDAAAEVVAILRRDAALVHECGDSAAKWSACHDREKGGFDKVRECAANVATTCARVSKTLTERPATATTACGVIVESTLRSHSDAQAKFHKEKLEWLDKKKTALLPALRGRTLFEGCNDQLCEGQPFEWQYAKAGWSTVNSIECVKPLFVCDPPRGNVCWVSKIIKRLGIGPDGQPGSIRSAATGLELSEM